MSSNDFIGSPFSRPYIGEWAYGVNPHKHGILGLSLTDAHYVRIGRIAAHMAGCEDHLQRLLWAVMGLTPIQGAALTVATRTETQIEAIKVLIASGMPKNPEHRQAITSYLKDLTDLRKKEMTYSTPIGSQKSAARLPRLLQSSEAGRQAGRISPLTTAQRT